jgi:hypothetical protein
MSTMMRRVHLWVTREFGAWGFLASGSCYGFEGMLFFSAVMRLEGGDAVSREGCGCQVPSSHLHVVGCHDAGLDVFQIGRMHCKGVEMHWRITVTHVRSRWTGH